MHQQLSAGQRSHDLTIATENIAGELFDLQAAGYAEDIDPVETAIALEPRYEQLWAELVSDEVVARDESYRINQRIKRLNALGFRRVGAGDQHRGGRAASCGSARTSSSRVTTSGACSS